MNTVKNAPKNGEKAKALPVVTEVKTTEVLKNSPEEESGKAKTIDFLEKYKPELPKSAESRIERAKQFEALSNRFGQLKDKSNELKTFQAGNDKLSAKVVFKNSQGFEFTVQNSNVIGKLLEAGEKELSILLAEAENEVLTFEI